RADRAVRRAGRARGDDPATSPHRLPFAQHGSGVDPGREGADPWRTPWRAASGAGAGARSETLTGLLVYSKTTTGRSVLATLGKGKNRPTAKRPGPAIMMGSNAAIASR